MPPVPTQQSQVVGAVVGTFKVGDGHVVGPPVFQPGKPKLILRGKHFNVIVAGDLKQVSPGKPQLRLRGKTFQVNISSTVAPSAGVGPLLILRGKTYRVVTPGRQITGKPRMLLKGKPFRLNVSQVMRPGKARLILTGGEIAKAGKAGLVPTVPQTKILVPSAVVDFGNLVPTPAYTDDTDLLVPTVERTV